jgi:cytochrome c556
MVHLLRPTSDAVFYIATRMPATDAEWGELQAKTLVLAETANLLMLPERTRGRAQWQKDAQRLLDAGRAAVVAARKRDVAGLEALNDQLYASCTTCHEHFRPGYARRP